MRTQQVIHEGVVVIVRSKYRRTPIIEAQYTQALRKAFPSIAEFETKLFAIPIPSVPTYRREEELTDVQRSLLADYASKIAPVRAMYSYGAELSDCASGLVPYLARIIQVAGAPFVLAADGRFDDSNVLRAFEASLEEDTEDEDTFWFKLRQAVVEVDAPVTTTADKPPANLTAEEKIDPLSEPQELSVRSPGNE